MAERLAPLTDLPGGELLLEGMEDLRHGIDSIPALLVLIGAPRLRQLAFDLPRTDPGDPLPEHRLYERLAEEHGKGAHSQYNALLRTLTSFTRAAACVH